MSVPAPGAYGHIINFRQWVEDNKRDGLTGEGNPAKYVPYELQESYWDQRRIQKIFQSHDDVVPCNNIRSGYVRVLSILAYITSAGNQALSHMNDLMRHGRDDSSLPWPSGDNRIVFLGHGGEELLAAFLENQWLFCPVNAIPFRADGPDLSDRFIDRRQVFPITRSPNRPSRTQRRVTVSYMDIPSLIQPGARYSIGQSEVTTPFASVVRPTRQARLMCIMVAQVPLSVVFKTYPSTDEQLYQDELKAYKAVQNATNSDNILKCLGSFHCLSQAQQRSSTIILELADGGTFKDLFLKNRPPYCLDDIRSFWKSFVGVVLGLETLHHLGGYRS